MQHTENTVFDNRYRLIRLLGRGGFSEVWLVEDTKLDDAQAALKIYAPGTGLDTGGTALFRQEFKIVSNLNHTNLLRPSHFDECDNRPYLLMPFCEQGSAKKFVGEITEEQAWHFLHDVAAGLEYLHSQETPVIHQDIKPDNILLNSKGVFLVTDFGISTKARSTLRRSVSDNTGAGTLAYMAPERFGKDPLPIKAGDIWALGASVFELLTGNVPFGEHGGLIQKSGAEIPNIKASCSDALKELVYKCLAKEPWDRPKADDIVEICEKHFKGEKLNRPTVSIPSPQPEAVVPIRENKLEYHGFITFWLSLIILGNVILLIALLINIIPFLADADVYVIVAVIVPIINILASILLLLRKTKFGVTIFIISTIIQILVGYGEAYFGLTVYLNIALFFILMIKKNGVSGWNFSNNKIK
ncbi:serine/threonine protein kinase [Candidatus Symbiothrix dinenymphae]|nr:serine/threonine protein kinase [Candidatus Symbiothrix dinenymphae]